MKEKVISSLKTRFSGVEEKTIERICEKLLAKTTPQNDDDVKAMVEGVTIQQVMESYADARVTEATKTAISNYEKKHGLKDGKLVDPNPDPKPKPEPNPKPTGGGDVPDWAKPLMEQTKMLADRLTAMDADRLTANRKKVLSKAIENLPSSFKAKFEKDFSRMSFKNDEDFQQWIDDDLKADVESIEKEINFKGATFSRPKGGGGVNPEVVDEALKARVEAQKKANETAKSPIVG